ncbi:MAG: TetR/AcrR family transcriptional regulator [Pseudomonadota bacterium]
MGVKERKERERERRRQQIIVAAKRVFSEKGFNKARMEDIAFEAELAPATLYIYFRSKEELFVSFSLTLLQYLSAKLKHIVNETGVSTESKLVKLRTAIYELYLLDPWGMGSLLQVQSGEMLNSLSPDFLDRFREMFQYSNQFLKSIFREGIEQGILVDRPPASMANVFWFTLSGVLLLEKNKSFFRGGDDSFKETLDFAFDIMLRGMTRSYLRDDMQDKVCCQCSLKPDCSGLRELFRRPAEKRPELVALSPDSRTMGLMSPGNNLPQAGCFS